MYNFWHDYFVNHQSSFSCSTRNANSSLYIITLWGWCNLRCMTYLHAHRTLLVCWFDNLIDSGIINTAKWDIPAQTVTWTELFEWSELCDENVQRMWRPITWRKDSGRAWSWGRRAYSVRENNIPQCYWLVLLLCCFLDCTKEFVSSSILFQRYPKMIAVDIDERSVQLLRKKYGGEYI